MERSAERSDSIKILISLHSHLEDFRIHVRSPSWISIALLHTRATKIEVRVNLTGDVVFAALLLAALRSGDRNHMLVAVHADKRRVGRSVDHTLYSVAHSLNRIRDRVDRPYDTLCCVGVDYRCRSVDSFKRHFLVALDSAELLFKHSSKLVHALAEVFFLVGRHTDNGISVAWDNVA